MTLRSALALLLASALLASCGSTTDLGAAAADGGPVGDSALCTTLPVPLMADPSRWTLETATSCPACPEDTFSAGGLSLLRGEPLIATAEPLVEGAFVWAEAAADERGTRISLEGEGGEASLLLRGIEPADLAWVPRGLGVEARLSVLPVRGFDASSGLVRGGWELVAADGRRLVRSFFEGAVDALPLTEAQRERFLALDRELTTEQFFIEWEGVRFLAADGITCEENNYPLGRLHVRGVSVLEADGARRDALPGQSLEVRLGDAPARVRGAFRTCFLRPEDRGIPPVATGYCSRGGGAEVLAVRLAP